MNHSKTIYVFDHFSEEKANGSRPKEDLLELWKRIVFSIAISNTDDHLRNHTFLLENNGWRLSPLYDVNPVPYGDELSLNVSEADSRISFALALETACRFGIGQQEAVQTVDMIRSTVKNNWERFAKRYGIGKARIEDMRPAFSACELPV